MQTLKFSSGLLLAGYVLQFLLVGCAAPAGEPMGEISTATLSAPTNTEIPLRATATQSLIPPAPTPTDIPPTVTPLRKLTATPVIVSSAEEILGLWFGIENRDGMYQQFNPDGTMLTSQIRDLIETNPNVVQDYSFEDGKLYLLDTPNYKVRGLPPCSPGDAIYQVEKYDNGNINFVKIEDQCSPRAYTMSQIHEPVR